MGVRADPVPLLQRLHDDLAPQVQHPRAQLSGVDLQAERDDPVPRDQGGARASAPGAVDGSKLGQDATRHEVVHEAGDGGAGQHGGRRHAARESGPGAAQTVRATRARFALAHPTVALVRRSAVRAAPATGGGCRWRLLSVVTP